MQQAHLPGKDVPWQASFQSIDRQKERLTTVIAVARFRMEARDYARQWYLAAQLESSNVWGYNVLCNEPVPGTI